MGRKANEQEMMVVRKSRTGGWEECDHVPLALYTQVSPAKAELAAREAILKGGSQSATTL